MTPGSGQPPCTSAAACLHSSTLLRFTTRYYTAIQCITLHYNALHCTTMHYTALQCITLHYNALHCTTMHYTVLQCITLYLRQKKIQNVNFFQIGLDPPTLPPQNVNFLKYIFEFLSIRQKIDLLKCKFWGRPPSSLLEKVYILIFLQGRFRYTVLNFTTTQYTVLHCNIMHYTILHFTTLQ